MSNMLRQYQFALVFYFLGSSMTLGNSQGVVFEADTVAVTFFQAEKLLQQGHSLLASRQWRKVLADNSAPPIFRKIAGSRVNFLSKEGFNYSLNFNYQPKSQRKYTTDVFYVNVNGNRLPFVATREDHSYDTISLNQRLSFPSLMDGRISGVEMFALAHNLQLQNNGKFKNTLTSSVTFENSSLRFITNWNKTINHSSASGQKTTEDQLEMIYVGVKALQKIQLAYVRPFNTSKAERSQLEYIQFGLSSKKMMNKNNFELGYKRYIYNDSEKNYYTLSSGFSHPLEAINTILSARFVVRIEDNVRFPFGYERNDNLFELSASTKLRHLRGAKAVKFAYTRNSSNINIYDYDEFGMSINFGF